MYVSFQNIDGVEGDKLSSQQMRWDLRMGLLFFYFEKEKDENRGVMYLCSFVSEFYVFVVYKTGFRGELSDVNEVELKIFSTLLTIIFKMLAWVPS